MTIPLRDRTVSKESSNGRLRSCSLPVRATPMKQLRNVSHLTIMLAPGSPALEPDLPFTSIGQQSHPTDLRSIPIECRRNDPQWA